MKEQLVSLVISRVGIDSEKAEQAVEAIIGYIKENPQQLSSYLENFGPGNVSGKLGGFFGK